MSHKDAGNYKGKHTHPTDTIPELDARISSEINKGQISCESAHRISTELGVDPADVGKAIDGAEVKISRCQLGLFGHEKGRRIVVAPADLVSDQLETLIRAKTTENRISCLSLWEIAEEVDSRKMEMTAACEAMGIKITSCQLGAF